MNIGRNDKNCEKKTNVQDFTSWSIIASVQQNFPNLNNLLNSLKMLHSCINIIQATENPVM